MQIREEVDHHIWWQVKAGNCSFWFDNWTKLGALYYIEENNLSEKELEVKEFVRGGQWNRQKLLNCLSDEDIVDYIWTDIKPPHCDLGGDKVWWMGNSNGLFSMRSSWDMLRTRHCQNDIDKCLWVKGLPFKINFFFWKARKGRIATDDNLRRMRINIVSRCWCCEGHAQETMSHLFFTAPMARKVWSFFANWVGVKMKGLQLHLFIKKWWTEARTTKLQQLFNAIPPLVCWELWKKRNSRKHGEDLSFNTMIHNIRKIFSILWNFWILRWILETLIGRNW